MLIPIKLDRASKPPLGTPLRTDGHWSVQGLIGAWSFNEGGGSTVHNAVTSKPSVSCVGDWTPEGHEIFSNAGEGVVTDAVSIPSCVTMFFKGRLKNLQYYDHIVSLFGSTGVYSLHYPDPELSFTTDGSHVCNLGMPASLMNSNITLCGTYGPAGSNGYVNGLLVGNNPHTFVTPTAIDNVGIGRYVGGDGWQSSQVTDIVCVFGLELTPPQIKSISANPWQIYEPETVWVEVGETAHTGAPLMMGM